MFRAELDALPIEEVSHAPHRSKFPVRLIFAATMAIARRSSRSPWVFRTPAKRGRAVLLFQPAEENGVGAAAVIADPKFAEIAPDFIFAWHNMPGLPFGRAALAAGAVNCASRGMRAILSGSASHASTPELGVSPLRAVAKLMPKFTALGKGGPLDAGYSLSPSPTSRWASALLALRRGTRKSGRRCALSPTRRWQRSSKKPSSSSATRRRRRICGKNRLPGRVRPLRKRARRGRAYRARP